MRTRTRSASMLGRYKSRNYNSNGTQIGGSDSTALFRTLNSQIIDDPGKSRGIKTVDQYQAYDSLALISLPYAQASGGQYATVEFERVFGSIGTPLGTCNFTAAMQSLIDDATGAMPLQASFVVNAVEAATLRDLVPGLLQAFTGFKKHKWTKRSLKDLAGSHLAYSFGLAPLVQDLKGFLGTRAAIQARIRELESRNGKTIRLAKRVTNTSQSSRSETILPGNPNHIFSCSTLIDTKSVGTVSADVSSWFIPNGESQCKMWSSALGLSAPLSNVWELIPFSFVIDWFIPIGNAFASIESKLGLHETTQSCTLSNFCTSIKSQSTSATRVTVYSSIYPSWNKLEKSGSAGTCVYYKRSPGMPGTSILTTPSGWSWGRSALSLSLILQFAIK